MSYTIRKICLKFYFILEVRRRCIIYIYINILQVSLKVQESLVERASAFGLVLDDISLVRKLYYRVIFLTCIVTGRNIICNKLAYISIRKTGMK